MNRVFSYLLKGFSPKKIMIYGAVTPEDLASLGGVDLTIVYEDTKYLLKLREQYPDLQYESSLYFLQEPVDMIINLTHLPIPPEKHLVEEGVYITINPVLSDFDYHAKSVHETAAVMRYHKQIKLHFSEGIVALAGEDPIWFDPREITKRTPDYLVECHSNRVIRQGNGVFLMV